MNDKKLLVIESPNKIRTLQKFLPADFEIIATIGHIRDLSNFGLGFDRQTMAPRWVIPKASKKRHERSKQEIIAEIKRKAKQASEIYLASDPDREGEAISWHVYDVLNEADQKKCKRIVFNEISQPAVLNALAHPRAIDTKWVESQFARRIIDRMIGFKLSQLVQRKLRAESAGRVQSVTLKFIHDREQEIAAFVPTRWWTLDIILENDVPLVLRKLAPELAQTLAYTEPKEVSGIDFSSEAAAEQARDSLGPTFAIYSVDPAKFSKRAPKEPYRTSTLQQDAVNKLNWNTRKTSAVAQRLYEGVDIDGDHRALISYPRTDSVRVATAFATATKKFIHEHYGEAYVGKQNGAKPEKKTNGDVKIQDAHEAIRPIDITFTPEMAKGHLKDDEYALYKLIWVRTVAAFMSAAEFKRVDIRFINAQNKFYATSRQVVFDGYRKIYRHYEEIDRARDLPLANLQVGAEFKAKSIVINAHETAPPPRYTQASLIAMLEKSGIGRPSTYNAMANVALSRGYAVLEKRAYLPTALGSRVIDQLEGSFGRIINKEFTRSMEEKLDDIANGKQEYAQYLAGFWHNFEQEVAMADQKIKEERQPAPEIGRACPQPGCEGQLVKRYSPRNRSEFIGCNKYPACKHTEPLDENKVSSEPLNEVCPECQKPLIERFSFKTKKRFTGCTGFNDGCRYIKPDPNKKRTAKKASIPEN